MKKSPEPMRAVDNLPSFLDSQTDADISRASQRDVAADEAEQATATLEGDDEGTAGQPTEPDAPAASDAATTTDDEAAAPSPRKRGAGSPPRPPRIGGTLALALGIVALLGAPVSVFLPVLATYGFTPNLLLVLGALLVAAGMTQRHVSRMQLRLEEAESRRREDASAVHQNLQLLVDDSQRDKTPAQGEELQHVLMSLQRQDEKINNLTKAIKMYGKPLMEISGQGTEQASAMATLKSLVEGGTESARQSINRLEAQVRAATSGKDLAEVTEALQKLAARVEAAARQTPTLSLEPLQQQLGRIEVNLAAMAQRLEDNEVRKSLMRLEDATLKGREAVQELLKGDSVQKAAAQLQSRVDAATKGLADGLTQLREGNLGGLESAVREIQREVSGVATTVAQINAAVKSGMRVATSSPAPTASPTSPEPAAPPTTASATLATAATAAAAHGTDGSGSYQTGTRTSGGKNVLGAIAKLKQMKG